MCMCVFVCEGEWHHLQVSEASSVGLDGVCEAVVQSVVLCHNVAHLHLTLLRIPESDFIAQVNVSILVEKVSLSVMLKFHILLQSSQDLNKIRIHVGFLKTCKRNITDNQSNQKTSSRSILLLHFAKPPVRSQSKSCTSPPTARCFSGCNSCCCRL